MSRISKIHRKDWPAELASAFGNQEASELQLGLLRMMAHKPAAAAGLLAFNRALGATRELTDRLTELVRLRIAFHNQCRSCMAIRYRGGDGETIDEGLVCALEYPQTAADLSEAELLALAYADLFCTDHLAIGDDTYAGLRSHFSEAQIVELGLLCALCVGVGRLGASWNMVEELPDDYHDHRSSIAPWRNRPVEQHGRR